MRVFLVRHFPVQYTFRFCTDSRGFERGMQEYDQADIRPLDSPFPRKNWTAVYSSTLKRASETARLLAAGNWRQLDVIREVPLHPAFETKFKIPTLIWLLAGRFCWSINSSRQRESRQKTYSRARHFLGTCCDPLRGKHADLLVVSHGFFMRILARVLRQNGFSGPRLRRVRHGFPFVFEED